MARRAHFADVIDTPDQIQCVPLHTGYREHPQNASPAYAPFLATRLTMDEEQSGQAGDAGTSNASIRLG